jgi:hypothetical protein
MVKELKKPKSFKNGCDGSNLLIIRDVKIKTTTSLFSKSECELDSTSVAKTWGAGPLLMTA